MHNLVSFNCKPVEASDPTLPCLASGALYGKGVFTTIAIFDYAPFLWEKHWRRLTADAVRLGVDLDDFVRADSLERVTSNALDELLGDNKVATGRARITFFDESSSTLWPYPARQKTSLLITTSEFQPGPAKSSLTVSPYRINAPSPLAGIKSCNYLEKILGKDEANQRGFDEGDPIKRT